jgi:hypothetical protein
MYFWSKGLGKRSHLVIACGSEDVEQIDKGENLKLLGNTRPPVEWNYEITMDQEDAVSVLKLGLTRKFARYLVHPTRLTYAFSLLYWIFVLMFNLVKELLVGGTASESPSLEDAA